MLSPRYLILALLVTTAGVAGQGPFVAQVPAPTFKAGTDVVVVDAVVNDNQGNVIRSLTKDDFTLLQDGKPQPISAFAFVDIPVPPVESAARIRTPEPDVQTNEHAFAGRVYMLLLDDINTDGTRSLSVKTAARRFIEEYLHDDDLMAVVYTGRSNVGHSFTNNRQRLLADVDQFYGRKDQMLDAMTPLEDPRSRNARKDIDAASTLVSVRGFAEWMGDSLPGRHKAMVLFSEGLAGFRFVDDGSGPFGSATMSRVADEFRSAVAAAARANVSVFTVDPRGGSALLDQSIADEKDTEVGTGADSLRALALETGGVATVHSNNIAAAFDRVVRDNSAYYVLAYTPPVDKKPGTYHAIDVKVNRPGVEVRARKGYVGPEKPPAHVSDAMPAELRPAITSLVPVSGLTLRVFATPFKGAGRNASVLVGVDVRGRDLGLTQVDTSGRSLDQVDMAYLVADLQSIKVSRTAKVRLMLKPDSTTIVRDNGIRILQRLDVPPGAYQLRVAAHDSNSGRTGSVLLDLDVPDFDAHKNTLGMSGIVLTSYASAPALVAVSDERLKQALPRAPSALRVFAQSDEIAAFVEIYDSSAKASSLPVTTSVIAADGHVVLKSEERPSSLAPGGRGGIYDSTIGVSLKDFAPGAYVLRIEARSRVDNRVALREVPFTVSAR